MNKPELPKRKNLWLEHYDYSQNGGYFEHIIRNGQDLDEVRHYIEK